MILRELKRLFCQLLFISSYTFFSSDVTAAPVSEWSQFWMSLLPSEWLESYLGIPKEDLLGSDPFSKEVRYGRELIVNTAEYIGPNGKVGKYLGNSMNCGHCHINAGRQPLGGGFYTTHSQYPQWRPRENIIISLSDRINLCIMRPHVGKPMPSDTREMRALLAYYKWLSQNNSNNQRKFGDELPELPSIHRAADPERGRVVFKEICAACHGDDGLGKKREDGISYTYPPLWGPDSFSIGSSMHRVRKAAAFIKYNMPHGTTWQKPALTDEQAYDVAAFVTDERINPRPMVDVSKDYPIVSSKPHDYPYGPYADGLSEDRHRFGPWDE